MAQDTSRLITGTELMAMKFCVVPWCEERATEENELYCAYHLEEHRRHEADMLSLDDPA